MTTEVSPQHLTNGTKLPTAIELNNNNHPHQNSEGDLNLIRGNSFKRMNVSRVSVSSASSSNSDISEDTEITTNFGNETEDVAATISETDSKKDHNKKEFDIRKFRSMSDGQAGKFIPTEYTDVFPSLPDAVLGKLGLLGEGPRERMNEEELEQKFVTLALAFTIDAATIKDRCTRQKRFRDQTEANLNAEINKLIEKVACIQPLCIDIETAELLTGLLAQIDVVIRATHHAATSAERFGAVQHEERLAEAVNLMINHVTLLKQQRDSTRKQLQYTKKVLQDTDTSKSTNATLKGSITTMNGKVITRRRASIATVSQPRDSGKSPPGTVSDVRRITRRTSDLSSRVPTLSRSSRPSRLEFGVDLDNIKEGIMENGRLETGNLKQINKNKGSERNELEHDSNIVENLENDASVLSLRQKLKNRCMQYIDNIHQRYESYTEDGTLHDFFYFAALLCFVLGLITLGNLLVEIEYSRLGVTQTHSNTLWNKMFNVLFSEGEVNNKGIKN